MFTLFRDEEVFSPEHVPDVFTYREPQMAALQYCLTPALRKQRPVHALLVGRPATGKTTALRIALQQLEDASDAIPAHIHCANATTYRILADIHQRVVGFRPPETGVPLSRATDAVFKKLGKRPLVVALDDVADITSISDALYTLLRAHETYPAAKVGVLIASTKNELHRLDERCRSSFSPEVIQFGSYTTQQIADILHRRAAAGLYPGAAPREVLELIAESADDIRVALEMLRSAALKAEAAGKKHIGKEHVQAEQKKEAAENPLLKALRGGPMDSGMLYAKLKKTLSYSKFYRELRKLEAAGSITIKKIQKGKGKSRLIQLKNNYTA